MVLADDVVVEERADLAWRRQLVESELGGVSQFLFDDLVAQVDAFVADVDAGTGDQLLDLFLRLATERALQQLAGIPKLGHSPRSVSSISESDRFGRQHLGQ